MLKLGTDHTRYSGENERQDRANVVDTHKSLMAVVKTTRNAAKPTFTVFFKTIM
jgi:hypothetical protein